MIKRCLSLLLLFWLIFPASIALAGPHQPKFFPLKREGSQQGAAPATKFYPLEKGRPLRLTFSPSKKQAVPLPAPQPEAVKPHPDAAMPGSTATQLLSIYPSAD